MAAAARRLTQSEPWQCPHCDYCAPVDSMLPEHIHREHPNVDEGDE